MWITRFASRWGTSSRRRAWTGLAFGVIAGLIVFLAPASLQATVFYTQKEALALAFPEADRVEKETYILTSEELESIQKSARSRLTSRLVTLYTAWQGGERIGFAHIDVHTVRTKPEGFLVVLDGEGHVEQVVVLAFYEPLDYLPPQRWYDLFMGRSLEDKLRLGRDVDAITGATLSARAATEGVRRMLAYHRVLLNP